MIGLVAAATLAGGVAVANVVDSDPACGDVRDHGTILHGGILEGGSPYTFSGLLAVNQVDRYSFGFTNSDDHYLVMAGAGDADLLICGWTCPNSTEFCNGRRVCTGVNLAFVPESCSVGVNPGGNPGFGHALPGHLWYTMDVYYCWGVGCGYPVNGPPVAYVGEIV